VSLPEGVESAAGFWFGEDQARYLVTAETTNMVIEYAAAAGVPAVHLGQVSSDLLSFRSPDEAATVELSDLRAAHESFFAEWMEA
jgi:phosphoribosylformylglycinamidine synthase